MGKHLMSREERIVAGRKKRKFMNKRHHLKAKDEKVREEKLLELIRIRGLPAYRRRIEYESLSKLGSNTRQKRVRLHRGGAALRYRKG
jgi:hypothetical protein